MDQQTLDGASLDTYTLSRHRCSRKYLTIHCLVCGHEHKILSGSLDRTCPACMKTLNQRIFDKYEEKINQSKNLIFLTLTWKPVKRQNPEIVHKLGFSLVKLLHRKRFRHYKGILATVECKKTDYGAFYYHMHCLIEGKYIPQSEISQAWKEITGFPIVWVERVRRTPKKALRYILKYVTKGMNFAQNRDREDFKASFRGVRFIRSYGEFYGLHYKSGKHVYFPCPDCSSRRSWVVLDFGQTVDFWEGKPYEEGI